MAQGRKGKLNYRCPRCLMREIDMDMLYDRDADEYYCLRCSFTGNEKEVLASTPSSAKNIMTGSPASRNSNQFCSHGITDGICASAIWGGLQP